MQSNKYSRFGPIFPILKHECSKQLIAKLFNILCWFKIELSDDLYSYIVAIMFKTFATDIRVAYAFNDNNQLQPISKLSYDFKIILEKYYGNNERGTNILKHISCEDYMNKLGIHNAVNTYRHFVNDSIFYNFKKSNTHFNIIKQNETKSSYNNFINFFFPNNNTHIDNHETIVMCAQSWFRKPIYIILIFTNDNVETLICCVDCTFVEHFISPGNNTYQVYEEQYDDINDFVKDITENNIIDIKKKLIEFLIEENLSTHHTNLLLNAKADIELNTIQPECFLSEGYYSDLPYKGRKYKFGLF